MVGRALPTAGVVACDAPPPIRIVGVGVEVAPVRGEVVKVGVGVIVGVEVGFVN